MLGIMPVFSMLAGFPNCHDSSLKVATEMELHVLAYNLTRVINILGVKPLTVAMRA